MAKLVLHHGRRIEFEKLQTVIFETLNAALPQFVSQVFDRTRSFTDEQEFNAMPAVS